MPINWTQVQRRYVDPYSSYHSDNVNSLNRVYEPTGNVILSGLELSVYNNTTIKITKGSCLKDSTFIEFKEDILLPKSETSAATGQNLIVVQYKYEKIYPANIAKIDIIPVGSYVQDKYLILGYVEINSSGNFVNLSYQHPTNSNLNRQSKSLDVGDLNVRNDVTIGEDSSDTFIVNSTSIFKSGSTFEENVLMEEDLDIEGDLTVNGLSHFKSDVTMDEDLVVHGNLTVNGTTTQINTEQLKVSDNIITLNSDFTTGTPTQNAGLEVLRGSLPTVSLYWNETIDRWELTDSLNLFKISFDLPNTNTDPLEIYRYNAGADSTHLRVRIGDNLNSTADKFVVGVESGGTWTSNLELDTSGNLTIRGNVITTGSFTGTVNWTNITNKPDPTITLSGDATGSVTLTDVGNGTLTVTVLDNSHRHNDSTLDSIDWSKVLNKPDPKITLAGDATGSVTLTDVGSGTLTVTVIDNSHNHDNSTLTSIDWSKVLNKPDPIITLAGDATGSVTLTDLGNGTLTVTVVDNSHSHDNTTLGSIDWSKVLNKPDPTITLAGDASGSVTLTDLGSGTLTVTVLDDSHNHVISNIDGLQSTLDGKANISHTHTISNITGLQSALDGKANISHTHAISNITGLQSALDGKASTSHTHTAANITNVGAETISTGTPYGGSHGDKWFQVS